MKTLLAILLCITISIITKAHVVEPQDNSSTEIVSLEKVPVVGLSLNGKTAYFILDSGSDVSLIHLAETGKFQFAHQKRAVKSIVGTSGGSQPLFQASGVELQIGQHQLQTTFYATDLSSVVNSLSTSTGYTISGIIGMDLMHKYGFEIDYGNQKLVLHAGI